MMLENPHLGVGTFALTDGTSTLFKDEKDSTFTELTDNDWTRIEAKCPHLVGATATGTKYVYGWPIGTNGAGGAGVAYFKVTNDRDKSFVTWITARANVTVEIATITTPDGPADVLDVKVEAMHDIPALSMLWPIVKETLTQECIQ